MDPLDREKPWSAWGQLTLITLVIAVVYLFFRWAVVVPEWGWRLTLGGTAAGAGLYFLLMIRTTRSGEVEPRRSRRRAVLAVMVVAALTLPVWVLLYLLWTGQKLP